MRIAATALAGALIAAVVCLAITPARHWTQEQAVCRGADYVGRSDKAIRAFAQDPDKVGLVCAYKDGRLEGIEAGNARLGGIGVSLGLGLLAGALVGVPLARRRRTR